MKIWHDGASSSPQKVCGVNNSVWLLAREQALQKHQVSLIIYSPPGIEALSFAKTLGIQLIYIPASSLSYDTRSLEKIVSTNPPELVHVHSVFNPRQASLCKTLVRYGIPYIASPRGGLCFRRGRIKKTIYSALIERPKLRNAAAITALTPVEETIIKNFLPGYEKPIRWLPNPIDVKQFSSHHWKYTEKSNTVVFLGRLDVFNKGLDLIVEIAKFLPEVRFDLYGISSDNVNSDLDKLKKSSPSNVRFINPVFDEDKARVLSEASIYIQMSRWEGFGRSIAEAMSVGLPCAIASTVHLSQIFVQQDLGLVLSQTPHDAAQELKKALNCKERLCLWSNKGRQFSLRNCEPSMVGKKFIQFYQEILYDQ